MIKSQYATQFTRQQQEGQPNPSRDMTNRKALEQPMRKRAWQQRQAAKKG